MGDPLRRTRLAMLPHGRHRNLLVPLAAVALLVVAQPSLAQDYSLRFYGHGTGDIDRIKIPLVGKPVNVGSDFTLEWWMKASYADNPTGACATGGFAWINGNIMFDRDVNGAGDFGDYGVSLYGGHIAFGVAVGSSSNTICSEANAADGGWHHIAVTRDATTGTLRMFLDGQLQPEDTGPTGNASYNSAHPSPAPNDPFLVIGAEKHDVDPDTYPSYNGLIDEVRLSDTIRYTGAFTPPSAAFVTDADTVALYHFDEGPAGVCANDATIVDDSGAAGGPSNGTCKPGGSNPQGPEYVGDTPFNPAGPTPTPTATPTPLCGAMPVGVGCRTPGKALLLVKDSSDDTKDKLIWKWLKGQSTNDVEFGDPVEGSTVYSLCVYDRIGDVPSLVSSATVLPGANWSATGSGSKYSEKTGVAGGITKVLLKPGGDGEAKAMIKGKGVDLQLPPPASTSQLFNLDTSLTVQLLSSGGPCWESNFSAAVKNEVGQFKAKTP